MDKCTFKRFIFLIILCTSDAQHFYDCPSDWQVFESKCYHFVYFPTAKYENARLKCQDDGSALVSINTYAEHSFISGWLQQHDPFQRSWFTSGMPQFDGASNFVWKGDGTTIKSDSQFWLPGQPLNNTEDVVIAYKYGITGYGWTIEEASNTLSYICEINQAEAYRIVQHNRDFDYGLSVIDPNNLEKGPKFTKQPDSVVVVGQVLDGELECIASGNPTVQYSWYRIDQSSRKRVTYETDERYTITNGKLSIQSPTDELDAGEYQCEASNKYGTILSNTVTLSFGRISEFSNVRDAAVRANAYDGVAIECSKITAKPAANYQWMKGSTLGFVRPELQPYMFISANGKLYFSEVTRTDAGEYRCIAVLAGVNKHSIGTQQPPSRTSLPIELQVKDQAAKANWGPEIQNDFIAVFPLPPLRGHDVRMECFAYGSSTTPFTYTWSRKDKPIPPRTKFSDHNRVIIIEDAQLEDQGTYTCVVKRGHSASDTKSITLRLGAEPYFIAPLQDQHVDIGSPLTWRCEARANPPAVYTWYKNGQQMKSEPGSITIQGNVLSIQSLDPKKHDGMYQCGASNVHGKTYSSAQLRVLSFEPNFRRFPMLKTYDGAYNGNMTLMCKPEGAPTPVITWFKNGGQLSAGNGHYEILSNGFLFIIGLQQGDEAMYMCKAENQYGVASDSTRVNVIKGTVITVAPTPTPVVVNQTAFLYCQASHDPALDLVYVWKFNGKTLKRNSDPHISFEVSSTKIGLYIIAAQLRHAGTYECLSITPFDSDSRSAVLTVKGPPGEPVGVYVDDEYVTKNAAHIRWTVGATNGRVISYYVLQHKTEFETEWSTVLPSVYDEDTLVDTEDKRRIIYGGLSPGTAHFFRLLAANAYGLGQPSLPSAAMTTPYAPPIKPPDNVRGGGGSVGDLTLRWDPLPRYEQGGPGIGYVLYWRKLSDAGRQWRTDRVTGNVDHYVHTVGQENFYLEYQIQVQAFNNEGMGPNSSIAVIFSAADMPSLTPTNVASDTYNGTALEVSWVPVPDTRNTAKGKILGYQINYWPDEGDYWLMFIRHRGQRDTGLVIGLASDTNFWVDVQVYNSAGLGPRSEAYFMETSRLPTNSYPEEVRVFSNGGNSCRVWWRGITTTYDEALISGYRVYYWPATEDFKTGEMYDTDGLKDTQAVLEDLETDVVYALRVGGISAAGEGKKSPTLYFTLGGQVHLDTLMAENIQGFLAKGSTITSTIYLLISSLLCLFLLN
ncbi:hypothetical protein SNE40_009468 [Patella caerulea]|uniref:Contactin n=1 Tax=Patella caerulea TaxID=87958 RepID=A0AAN8JVI9_PATCE